MQRGLVGSEMCIRDRYQRRVHGIEIDSGNMAKLLAGQYALLNGMYGKNKKNVLFLVIHYYKDKKTNTFYNPERTLKNLNAIQHFNKKASWIDYNVYNIEEIREIIKNVNDLDAFIKCIWPNEQGQIVRPQEATILSGVGQARFLLEQSFIYKKISFLRSVAVSKSYKSFKNKERRYAAA
eukprot:TRINITY_DN3147_c0_g2_i1.p1 TRINITY_DN3147_c0_g2~~TRINITY_DN3147_c0_g2_i1.p1  ORF type:complete len:180 (-),score=24.80 TRINITY_DN3147_c0_g2_i1:49-588(-)